MIGVIDDVLAESDRAKIHAALMQPAWEFGWKSNIERDTFQFWHRHLAGNRKHADSAQYDCEDELRTHPLFFNMWDALKQTTFNGYAVQRVYANGAPFGSEGTVHTDSTDPASHTAIYYPHAKWHPDWGGETILLNDNRDDIISVCYPKPNRLFIFPGATPHVARGVSRTCPVMRVVLVFKMRERAPS